MVWAIIILLGLGICYVIGGLRTWGNAKQRRHKSIFCVLLFGCKDLPKNHFDYGHCRRCGHKPE